MRYEFTENPKIPEKCFIIDSKSVLDHNSIEDIILSHDSRIDGLHYKDLNVDVLKEIQLLSLQFKPLPGYHKFQFSTGGVIEFYLF